ncbi:hypothetical protein J2S74_005509 [Evansella vedderi]|uniref:Uncharacterized protein n=1 Tax=Evansella vedderi TaxID=38282 RepID=A0ABU0A3H3_9BACI|nr:hypothetical protein [Evansella vedderi]
MKRELGEKKEIRVSWSVYETRIRRKEGNTRFKERL